MLKAHAAGCEFTKQSSMVPVKKPFDLVITTNSGFPLDLNLYQSVKGMSAANQIVRQGGAILIATACEDGVPEHGGYANLLKMGGTPEGILNMVSSPRFSAPDQWQVQIQALIQKRADVFVYSDGLTDQQISDALFTPSHDIPRTVELLQDKYGSEATIAVLPEGPQTIAYLG
jgi:nickel-dependent lactate racemase